VLTQSKKTAVAALTAVAIMGTVSAAQAANKPYKLGYMIWNASVPFYSNLIKKAQETAKEEGVTIDIQSGNGDLATQISIVQNFITQGVDMILISPSDPKGIVATAAGIPVMAVNTKADTSTGAQVVTYVGVDDFVFGQRQGELLAQAIGGKGKVGYIMGKLGTSAELDRKAGLDDTLKKHPEIEIVGAQAAD
jgi:ABC-type sugar transport system substrate-binding protein